MNPANERLLVVDDNELNRDMLSRRLQHAGHTVAVAADGRQALETIEKEECDLVLLDIMMPGLSGIEVLKAIRKTHSLADLPVIMVTAKDQSQDVVEALELGANDYVTKPIDFPVVRARVETQLTLRRLSQLKDDFLSMASHDLRNPLASIIGYSGLLEKDLPPGAVMTAEKHEFITRVKALAKVMNKIVGDFLDFQAMQDGQIKVAIAPLDLNALARAVMDGNAEYAAGKGIGLAADLAPQLPLIDADESRLYQALDNLVSNAIKFSGAGAKVLVRTRAKGGGAQRGGAERSGSERGASERGSVLVEVSDAGPGLTLEDMGKLFQKYARLSARPTAKEKSSGLGLAICKSIIDLHGGSIGARNNPNGGATFWFRLPVKGR